MFLSPAFIPRPNQPIFNIRLPWQYWSDYNYDVFVFGDEIDVMIREWEVDDELDGYVFARATFTPEMFVFHGNGVFPETAIEVASVSHPYFVAIGQVLRRLPPDVEAIVRSF